jgi:hypothetical protein
MNTIVLSSVKEALNRLSSLPSNTLLTVDGRSMRTATVHGVKVLRTLSVTSPKPRLADGRRYMPTNNSLAHSNAVLEV